MESTRRRKKKSIIIFAAIVAGIVLLAVIARWAGIGDNINGELSGASGIHTDFVGVLFIEGTISDDDSSGTYSHEYALDAVDGMMENDNNKGLMLYVNTPGGGVYESDELYLKIKEYQDSTGRPVYAYFADQATSGGYYISASADRIAANRNCWTGSIGVTIGNLYDISGLLEKYGIKVTTITSGRNKAMGDITGGLTDEQKQIFQSLVDESYDQFVGIVVEGRNLDEAYVRHLADGRIYTAKQAKQLELIDVIVDTYDDAVDDMRNKCDLGDYEVYEFRYEPEYSILSSLVMSVEKLADASAEDGDIRALTELMGDNNKMPLQYMCEVSK